MKTFIIFIYLSPKNPLKTGGEKIHTATSYQSFKII